jgi:hypothetical protein
MLQKLKNWYGCKFKREHTWRAPVSIQEQFPVCVYCGTKCWWLKGYVTNYGTVLAPDYEALALMNTKQAWLHDIPWMSRPGAFL